MWWIILSVVVVFAYVLIFSMVIVAKRADEQWERICEEMDRAERNGEL